MKVNTKVEFGIVHVLFIAQRFLRTLWCGCALQFTSSLAGHIAVCVFQTIVMYQILCEFSLSFAIVTTNIALQIKMINSLFNILIIIITRKLN